MLAVLLSELPYELSLLPHPERAITAAKAARNNAFFVTYSFYKKSRPFLGGFCDYACV
ncbi:MAG: hypothetical protein K6F91_11315 [Ruminococcus sp.]|nr:hypothetical protein [Ruminococcus sp.]